MKSAMFTIVRGYLRGKIVRCAVSVLLCAATLAFTLAYFNRPAASPPAAPGTLSGTAALKSLEERGQYASLAAAFSAARHQINAALPTQAARFMRTIRASNCAPRLRRRKCA
jgi:hypothetical protein